LLPQNDFCVFEPAGFLDWCVIQHCTWIMCNIFNIVVGLNLHPATTVRPAAWCLVAIWIYTNSNSSPSKRSRSNTKQKIEEVHRYDKGSC
jgi:hypothetical protein